MPRQRPSLLSDWRTPGQRPSAPVQPWRNQRTTSHDSGRRLPRNFSIAFGITAILLLIGATVWVSSWLHVPKQTSIYLYGAAYDLNVAVPENTLGWSSLVSLATLAGPTAGDTAQPASWDESLIRVQGPTVLPGRDSFARAISAERSPTVMVVVSGHGAADSQGPFVVADDVDPIEPLSGSILRVDDILESLQELPAETKKIVFFDATAMIYCPVIGVMQNDFVRGLRDLEPRIAAVPNLVVVSASDLGQRSWACPQWGQTAFGYFLLRGLMGRADTNGDGRVDGAEVFQYCEDQVADWVWSNRGARQNPVLFPSGEEGRTRAGRTLLTYIRSTPEPALPLAPAPTNVFEEIEAAWADLEGLSAASPAPWIYSPQLYRAYREALLRYEALMLAGAAESARKMKRRLADLGAQIEHARTVSVSSADSTLTMPVAAGEGLPAPTDAAMWANELWASNAKDFNAVWPKVQSQASASGARFRLGIYRSLLERAAADPVGSLARAVDIVGQIRHVGEPLPAEVHFAAMLRRDLPAPALAGERAELVREAIRCRILAEQAAVGVGDQQTFAYSVEIRPWIDKTIQAADGRRRMAEDLIFATDHESMSRSWSGFQEARRLYQAALADATIVQEALTARDKALADLPFYGRPLAAGLTTEGSSSQKLPDVPSIVELWRKTHQVAALLEHGSESTPSDATLPQLKTLAHEIQSGLAELDSCFLDAYANVIHLESPDACRNAEALRLAPITDRKLRLMLLRHVNQVSIHLLAESARVKSKSPDPPSHSDPWRIGRTAAQLALAALGQRAFDELSGKGEVSCEGLQQQIDALAVTSDPWSSLEDIGAQIRDRLVSMPARANSLLSDYAHGDSALATASLAQAEHLARLIGGYARLDVRNLATAIGRKHRLQEFLIWQANRSIEDHWFAEDPAAMPYFEVVGRRCAADAESLAVNAGERAAVASLNTRLAKSGLVTIEADPRVTLTSEPSLEVSFRVSAAADSTVPAGVPIVALEAGPSLELLSPRAGEGLLEPIAPEGPASVVTGTIRSPAVTAEEEQPTKLQSSVDSSLTLRGLFRGQKLLRETPVRIEPAPQLALTLPPKPARAGLAVSLAPGVDASLGTSDASLAIVLDASGSMGARPGESFDASTKYAQATLALEEVLRDLPSGVTVSLWLFGQAMGPAKTVLAAEQTIQRIQKPTTWKRNDPNQIQELMARVRYPAVEPWNESPIVRAMTYAKEDLLRGLGPKMLLVITDGKDNRLATDLELNPQGQDVPTFLLETFAATDIEVNVLGFRVDAGEEAEARRQFEVVKYLPKPGSWYAVADAPSLVESLRGMLRPTLRYLLESDEGAPLAASAPGGMTPPGADLSWRQIPPGGYNLRLDRQLSVAAGLVLGRGDLLLAELAPDRDTLAFQRALYSANQFPWKPFVEKSGWRAAVLQNQSFANASLAMLVTLERTAIPGERMLQQWWPGFAWFEVSSQDAGPVIQNWTRTSEYAAPAWKLDAPTWPKSAVTGSPSPPVLRMWWTPDATAVPNVCLQQGVDFSSLAELSGRKVDVENVPVVIQSVGIEQHWTPAGDGTRSRQPCLVVRLSSPDDQRVWASVTGQGYLGEEHRHYSACGSYTGLFWPAARIGTEGPIRINLHILSAFQRSAERRGCYIEMTSLAPPDPDDTAPKPPIGLH